MLQNIRIKKRSRTGQDVTQMNIISIIHRYLQDLLYELRIYFQLLLVYVYLFVC